nr:hypothetical protein BaRGS_018539 [Batillaria attramentaria]
MLSSLHIVFHRLHNVVAIELAVLNPHWDDERLYQESRKIVGAVMQHVTYAEYLPLVLGDQAMRNYNLALDDPTYKYDPSVDPSIINAFSTAAFRFGHSMVNGKNSYGFQKLNLRDMFFHPSFVQHDYGAGLRMVINGLVRDHAQSTDRFMNLDLTDHLFQTKDGRSLDLAALNIQRGRDHGLSPFNDYREFCGLPRVGRGPAREFSDAPFLSAYSDYDEIDLFTGGLSERPVPGGVVGPTFACIIGKQFRNIRLGDRFWYQNLNHAGALTPEQILYVESLGLSDLICLTTSVAAVQISPFLEPSTENPVRDCSTVPPIDLFAWKEV